MISYVRSRDAVNSKTRSVKDKRNEDRKNTLKCRKKKKEKREKKERNRIKGRLKG
jgi:hypothetical protein